MAANRSTGRNAHIYDVKDPGTVLGGLILTNSVTNANFYSMIEEFLFINDSYILRHEDGMELQSNKEALRPGKYYIITNGSIAINNEPWLVRTLSATGGTRVAEFRDAVRERDRRCVITGKSAVNARGSWTGFQAAHIFPLAYEGYWIEHHYDRWITLHPKTGGPINSVQNGLLLDSTIHALFDTYDVSINPDDNYKIVCFNTDREGIAGKYIELGSDECRPVDQLLRWHFRQAVLANMRGVGEPVFEVDFPPGSDMMGEILSGPMSGERMEFELFSRLAAH